MTRQLSRRDLLRSAGALGAGAAVATFGTSFANPLPARAAVRTAMQDVVPIPAEIYPTGTAYTIGPSAVISSSSSDTAGVAQYLAKLLRPSTGYRLPIVHGPVTGPSGGISLALSGAPDEVGEMGYSMSVSPDGVMIRANQPAGLFAGVQTLRQSLPAAVESSNRQPGPWNVPGAHVVDYPRFGFRSAMLDVARHFFTVEAVKKFIDQVSMYKINHLHLHLSDDQGWRIQIDSWPRLTTIGGSTDIDGGPGGYYTKAEYREIVDYARSRYITLIPEIDMPSHMGGALASYAELNCDGQAPPIYPAPHGHVCVEKEITYQFVDDVIRELAAMTPGPYLHIGGDEAYELTDEQQTMFMERALSSVQKYGKTPIGWQQDKWQDAATSSTVLQYWVNTSKSLKGYKLIASYYDYAYLDLAYKEGTPPWATHYAYTSVKESYSWDPGTVAASSGASESQVMGTESPLWSEQLVDYDRAEFMAFPRLPGIAELGWSPASKTASWDDYKYRLAAQAPRWEVLGIDYYESPEVPWGAGSS